MSARVYVGLREGRLAAQDVVDLACELMDQGHGSDAVREVVERHPAQVTPQEMAGLAGRILAQTCFDPGFDLAPERLDMLRHALRIAARDLPAAGIVGEPRLVVMEDAFPVAAGVVLADGRRLSGDGRLHPCTGDDRVGAVAAVACLIQEDLLKQTWKVWPECADHGLGVHIVEHGTTVVWWCMGMGGHVLARVGELAFSEGGGSHHSRSRTRS
ncbi:hypothetical protein [Streptomyces sp. NPDC005181]|uniref:hypothetical protein n=1 Tax=Streptomyces sp. NPDC005181 TaxID=3156869 RepID=UPI0033B3F087